MLKEKIKRFESGQEYQKLVDENQRPQCKVERCQTHHNQTEDRLGRLEYNTQ
ncbi:hypothetical protein IM774_10825 [Erysipelotrichaceae bacterium RD49]|nr:hypothetical protein [Erysipelotrichaceae bacterium RD49]